ncbi:MAG: spermidine synthase [Microcoleaceae cyanobacterium]
MAGNPVKADFWLSDYLTPWDVYLHGVTRILAYKKTAYQEMYIVETGSYDRVLLLDGKCQSTTKDEFIYHEALVHPAMIYQRAPRTVLILGGGEGAVLREVLRWRTVERVVMVDIDGEVVDACRQYLPEMSAGTFEDPRVELIIGDAFAYVETAQPEWDVVISDLSDPVEDGPSFKLFTKEYFEKIRGVLNPQGLVSVQAGSTGVAQMQIHVRLIRTLMDVFPAVRPYGIAIPSFCEPWGFALAALQEIPQPDPTQVDQLLSEQITGNLQMLDGSALLGLLQIPTYLRQAIAIETQRYTLADPPKDFGTGILKGDFKGTPTKFPVF